MLEYAFLKTRKLLTKISFITFIYFTLLFLLFLFFSATWVGRTTLADDDEELVPITLSTIQKEKFSHFFYNLLDSDRNDLISKEDFDVLSEVHMSNPTIFNLIF